MTVSRLLVGRFQCVGGAIPIYLGSTHAFDIFNSKSMVIWDPASPEAALAQIRRLEANRSAWSEMVARPVLKEGERTLQEYFSVTDRVGGGVLKARIRKMVAELDAV